MKSDWLIAIKRYNLIRIHWGDTKNYILKHYYETSTHELQINPFTVVNNFKTGDLQITFKTASCCG